ncbi:hypothetical protein ILUMI_01329 [Ignelater luminosus]|uniref:Glutamate receptor ionotropic, kainate 2 n=1 Tax=Ignelater luminosus TaxID=2038154 RepID=A0A8K0GPC3_IGNLU|nr:hypothetical protein ILUMI_01329 [Ignelater luminosus]
MYYVLSSHFKKMKIIPNLISVLVIASCCYSICEAYSTDSFTIAALFNQATSDAELAFKYTIQWQNIYSSEDIFYKVEIFNLLHKNVFVTSKTVCNISKMESGVIAIFGPEALKAVPITQSICRKLEIPHIQTTWQPSTSYPPLISLNFYPAADLLAEGFATIVRHMNWKSYAIVYQHDEALIRLQQIFKIPDVSDNPVVVRQLEPGLDHRPLFKGLKDSGVQKIILDCDTDDILKILQQAKDVDFLSVSISYLLTSLDAHTLDYSELDASANITLVRLFDPTNEELSRNINSWKVGENRNRHRLDIEPEIIRTEAALMIDAVNLFVETVNHLHKTEMIVSRPMDCDGRDTWEGGYRIVSYMKEHKLANPITGPIGFDEFGRRVNFTLYVVELNADRIVKATWSPSNNTRLNITISATERRQLILKSLQKQKIIVSTKIVSPYFMLRNKSHSSEDTSSKYEGYAVDLIEKISQELNFTYDFYLNDANGNYDENSQTWTGVVGDVVSGTAQLGICDLTVTQQRRKYVDFSNHFMTLGISILYKKPTPGEPNMFAFLGPLAEDVWMYTATAYLGVSVLIYLIARMAPGDWESSHPCDENPKELENIWSLGNCLWLTKGSIMTQGCDILPKGISTRMAVSMWWFFSLLMTSSYTANLAAYLSKERMGPQINSLDDLVSQNKIKFGTMINGSTYQFFKTSNYSKHQAAWNKMNNFKPSSFVKTNTEGVRKVLNKNQDYAFFMESSSMEYEINRHKCELRPIGGLLDSKGYGIAMPIDAAYRGEINDAILKFQETGVLQTLKDKWWKELNVGEACEETIATPSDGSLTLANVGGVFLVLGIGTLISFLISVIEFLWNVKNIAVEEHITYWEALILELRFVVTVWVTRKATKVEINESSSSLELSEARSIAEKVLQEAGSFLHLDTILDRINLQKEG